MGHQSSKQSVTVFHQAVRNGNVEKVKELLEQNIPLEDQDDVFGTPLHEAICFGRYEIAELLIQRKADVNSAQKNTSDTPLCVSSKKGLMPFVELLVEAHAKVNQVGAQARSPLHWAVECGHEEVACYLLEHGASVNAVDAGGAVPLHAACKKQSHKTTQALLSKPNICIDIPDKFHMTPLMYACQAKDQRLVDILLQSKAKVRYNANQSTPLHVVQSVECARAIIAAGGDVNARDETLSIPLHHTCGVINNYELVQLFIEHKADVNARDKTLSTPLHKACHGGALKNVQLLLRSGADVREVDEMGCSPLHVASKLGYSAISKILMEHGANPNLPNGEGFTPSQLALCAED